MAPQQPVLNFRILWTARGRVLENLHRFCVLTHFKSLPRGLQRRNHVVSRCLSTGRTDREEKRKSKNYPGESHDEVLGHRELSSADDAHSHSIFEIHITRERDHLSFLQAACNLVTCRASNAHLNFALLQIFFADAQRTVFHNVDITAAAL